MLLYYFMEKSYSEAIQLISTVCVKSNTFTFLKHDHSQLQAMAHGNLDAIGGDKTAKFSKKSYVQ